MSAGSGRNASPGGTPRRAPTAALERKAEVELQMYRGSYVACEERETPFRLLYRRWWDSGDWPICTIRPSDIDDWVARLSKTMGPQSVRACYGLLRGPLRRAVRDRVITDPCIDICLPKLPDITKTFDDVLTAEEVDRLVTALHDTTTSYAGLRTNHRYQTLVFMGAWLGPRWNEAIGLRICDVNPLRREVVFGRQVINPNGTHTFAEVGSKTGDWRTVPVPQPVMDALTAHIARYRDGASPD